MATHVEIAEGTVTNCLPINSPKLIGPQTIPARLIEPSILTVKQAHYHLSQPKALEKKCRDTNRQLMTISNKYKNTIVEFSTAAFQAVRPAIHRYFGLGYGNTKSPYTTSMTAKKDKGGHIEQEFIRVYSKGGNKDDGGKKGDKKSTFMYTVNLYITESKIMINGTRSKNFLDNEIPMLERFLQNHQENLKQIDGNICSMLHTDFSMDFNGGECMPDTINGDECLSDTITNLAIEANPAAEASHLNNSANPTLETHGPCTETPNDSAVRQLTTDHDQVTEASQVEAASITEETNDHTSNESVNSDHDTSLSQIVSQCDCIAAAGTPCMKCRAQDVDDSGNTDPKQPATDPKQPALAEALTEPYLPFPQSQETRGLGQDVTQDASPSILTEGTGDDANNDQPTTKAVQQTTPEKTQDASPSILTEGTGDDANNDQPTTKAVQQTTPEKISPQKFNFTGASPHLIVDTPVSRTQLTPAQLKRQGPT